MFGRIVLILLITPIIELALLIRVGRLIGFWPTLAIVAVTAILGSYMLRKQGLSVWRRFNTRLADGSLPGTELVDGVIILLAGALLITPGVLSDIVGIVGLLPPGRAFIRRIVMSRIRKTLSRGTAGAAFFGQTSDVEGWQGEASRRPGYDDDRSAATGS